MAAMVAGPMMELKKEEKSLSGGSMYPPEWWWAERQVSEVLAEHPGELVKTGETGTPGENIHKCFLLIGISNYLFLCVALVSTRSTSFSFKD